MLSKLILALFVSGCTSSPAPYKENVVRCQLLDADVANSLRSTGDYDFWSLDDSTADVRLVSSSQERTIKALFEDCQILIPDVQHLLASNERSDLSAEADFFDDYQSYDKIIEKLNEFAANYPSKVKLFPSIGKSYEGRDIPVIKITNLEASSDNKKAIWWNSGQHAREHIGPATVLYLAQNLLSSNDSAVANWLEKFEIYISPIQNPDGYEFSRTPGNRFWRKNRRKNADGTYGVDLNRNWDDHWSKYGSSSSPRSDVYHGTAPFSEPETKYLSDFILTIPNKYAGIDFHSYSQLVLRNWGWTTKNSKNENVLKELGDGISNAIWKSSGTKYVSEKGADLYPAAGATDDWMTTGAKMIGYTIELRDTGRYGFALPKQFIRPVGDEIWDAMKYFLDFLIKNDKIQPNQEI